ncbi:hypothetical protein BH09PLA1_BH09PLA1_16820 [soil metagenome]
MRRRAFTLWEMLTVIILLGTIGLILTRLFVATFRVIDSAPKAQDKIVRASAMLHQMRQDIWEASSVRVEGTNSLRADNVTWKIDHKLLVRTEGDERCDWPPIDAEFAFIASSAGVLLLNKQEQSPADDSILMAGQSRLLCANRGTR